MCRLAGRHFFLFYLSALDSNLPQVPILKEKPLIAGVPDLQMLAGESPDIVAFE